MKLVLSEKNNRKIKMPKIHKNKIEKCHSPNS